MDEMFIVCELSLSDNRECTGPMYVLRNRSAVESYFEEWYENEPHTCISDTGSYYRLHFNRSRGVIEPILNESIPPDKAKFVKLLSRYLDALEHRTDLHQSISEARRMLQEGSIPAMAQIRSMADTLGFI